MAESKVATMVPTRIVATICCVATGWLQPELVATFDSAMNDVEKASYILKQSQNKYFVHNTMIKN